jgi:hypothetical protein
MSLKKIKDRKRATILLLFPTWNCSLGCQNTLFCLTVSKGCQFWVESSHRISVCFFRHSFTSSKTARVSKWIETKNRHVCLHWLAVMYWKSRMVFIYCGCVFTSFGGVVKSLKTICPYPSSWLSFCPVITLGPVPERNVVTTIPHCGSIYDTTMFPTVVHIPSGTGRRTIGTSRRPVSHLRRNQI